MGGIDRVFATILALVILGAAIFFFMTSFGGGSTTTRTVSTVAMPAGPVPVSAEDVLCQCYDQAFQLAGADVGVMSSQYRTGFESCRAVGGAKGGEAWTAGWNARISSAPFQASCRGWLRRGA